MAYAGLSKQLTQGGGDPHIVKFNSKKEHTIWRGFVAVAVDILTLHLT